MVLFLLIEGTITIKKIFIVIVFDPQKELREIIIPFFKQYPLKTSKRNDFEKFSQVLSLMENSEHLHLEGVRKIIEIIETMNTRKRRPFF